MSHGRRIITVTSPACQRVLLVLRTTPLTAEQISACAHVSVNTLTAGGYLRAMESAGLVHVASWNPPARSGLWAPVWALGAGPSAPKPPRQSQAEYVDRWRKKNGKAVGFARRGGRSTAAVPPLWGWLAL